MPSLARLEGDIILRDLTAPAFKKIDAAAVQTTTKIDDLQVKLQDALREPFGSTGTFQIPGFTNFSDRLAEARKESDELGDSWKDLGEPDTSWIPQMARDLVAARVAARDLGDEQLGTNDKLRSGKGFGEELPNLLQKLKRDLPGASAIPGLDAAEGITSLMADLPKFSAATLGATAAVAALAAAGVAAGFGVYSVVSRMRELEALSNRSDRFLKPTFGNVDAVVKEAKDALGGRLTEGQVLDILFKLQLDPTSPLKDQFNEIARTVQALTDKGDLGGTFEENIIAASQAIAAGDGEKLKSLGIIKDVNQAYIDFARANNLLSTELDTNQKAQALINRTLSENKDVVNTPLTPLEGAQAAVDTLKASIGDATRDAGNLIAELSKPAVDSAATGLAGWLNSAATAIDDFSAKVEDGTLITGIENFFSRAGSAVSGAFTGDAEVGTILGGVQRDLDAFNKYLEDKGISINDIFKIQDGTDTSSIFGPMKESFEEFNQYLGEHHLSISDIFTRNLADDTGPMVDGMIEKFGELDTFLKEHEIDLKTIFTHNFADDIPGIIDGTVDGFTDGLGRIETAATTARTFVGDISKSLHDTYADQAFAWWQASLRTLETGAAGFGTILDIAGGMLQGPTATAAFTWFDQRLATAGQAATELFAQFGVAATTLKDALIGPAGDGQPALDPQVQARLDAQKARKAESEKEITDLEGQLARNKEESAKLLLSLVSAVQTPNAEVEAQRTNAVNEQLAAIQKENEEITAKIVEVRTAQFQKDEAAAAATTQAYSPTKAIDGAISALTDSALNTAEQYKQQGSNVAEFDAAQAGLAEAINNSIAFYTGGAVNNAPVAPVVEAQNSLVLAIGVTEATYTNQPTTNGAEAVATARDGLASAIDVVAATYNQQNESLAEIDAAQVRLTEQINAQAGAFGGQRDSVQSTIDNANVGATVDSTALTTNTAATLENAQAHRELTDTLGAGVPVYDLTIAGTERQNVALIKNLSAWEAERAVMVEAGNASKEAAAGANLIAAAYKQVFGSAGGAASKVNEFAVAADGTVTVLGRVYDATTGLPVAFSTAGVGADALRSKLQDLQQELANLSASAVSASFSIAQRFIPVLGVGGALKQAGAFAGEVQRVTDAFNASNAAQAEAGLPLAGAEVLDFHLQALADNQSARATDAVNQFNDIGKAAGGSASSVGKAAEAINSAIDGMVRGVLVDSTAGLLPENLLPRQDAVDEPARRMADVAVKGFLSPWYEGLKHLFPEDIMGQGEDAIKQRAGEMVRAHQSGISTVLYDTETAAQRVIDSIKAKGNMDELVKQVRERVKELGASVSDLDIAKALGVDTSAQEGAAAARQSAAAFTIPFEEVLASAANFGKEGGGPFSKIFDIDAVATEKIEKNKEIVVSTFDEFGEAIVTQAETGNYGTRALDTIVLQLKGREDDLRKSGRDTADFIGTALLSRFEQSVPIGLLNILVLQLVPLLAKGLAKENERKGGGKED